MTYTPHTHTQRHGQRHAWTRTTTILIIISNTNNWHRHRATAATRQGLRSAATTYINYIIPRLHTQFGERGFSYAGPSAWNCLLYQNTSVISHHLLLLSGNLKHFIARCTTCIARYCYTNSSSVRLSVRPCRWSCTVATQVRLVRK